jgi:hypothetical protein
MTLNLTEINFIKRPLLIGAAFLFFSLPTYASLKIAVIDTGFCSQRILTTSKKQIIKDAIDMTGSNDYDCKKVSDTDLKKGARFHGQNVLNEFLAYLPKDTEVSISPLVVYDKSGRQTAEAWKKSVAYIEAEKMDMVLTASGLIDGEKLFSSLPSLWFIPSGRVEHGITFQTVLFPQNITPQENIFVIGDYFPGKDNFYDQGLLYQNQIDYVFPSGSGTFTGASRAVAEAMARALEKCFDQNKKMAAKSLRSCLVTKEKILKDPVLKKEFKTF